MQAISDEFSWPHSSSPAEILDFHASMLLDEARMAAFYDAILATVMPGDVVIDIGTGTGILSLMACRAGASRVYAVESGPVIEVARELVEHNGFGDRIVFVNQPSTYAELPERADLLITETIGNAAFDEGIVAWAQDARDRLLKPDARIVPQRVDLLVAAVESWDEHAQVADWSASSLPFDFGPVRRRAEQIVWFADLETKHLLSEPVGALSIDLRTVSDTRLTAAGELVSTRSGALHGLACWFDAELVSGITLTNAPPTDAPSWAQGFMPVRRPVSVAAGDVITWTVSLYADGSGWEWDIDVAQARPRSASR
ncbi:MAG: 50S ribosomal protein L11 methyltransferase [Acidimicrobiales bacterium]